MKVYKHCSNKDCATEFPANYDLCPNCGGEPMAAPAVGSTGGPTGLDPAPSPATAPSSSAADTEESDFCKCWPVTNPKELCDYCGKPTVTPEIPADATRATDGIVRDLTEVSIETPEVTAPPSCPPIQIRFGPDSVLNVGQSLLIGRGYAGVSPALFDWLAAQPGISRRHCLIQIDLNGARLCDVGSLNGTRANGIPLRTGESLVLTSAVLPVALTLGRYAQIIIEEQEKPQ